MSRLIDTLLSQQCIWVLFSLHPHQSLLFLIFSMVDILTVVECNPNMDFIHIFLMAAKSWTSFHVYYAMSVMVNFYCSMCKDFKVSMETHLWVCQQGCFRGGLTEEGRQSLNMGSSLLWAGAPDWVGSRRHAVGELPLLPPGWSGCDQLPHTPPALSLTYLETVNQNRAFLKLTLSCVLSNQGEN